MDSENDGLEKGGSFQIWHNMAMFGIYVKFMGGIYICIYIYMTPHVRSVSCVVVVSCYLGSAFGLESKPPTKTNQISI